MVLNPVRLQCRRVDRLASYTHIVYDRADAIASSLSTLKACAVRTCCLVGVSIDRVPACACIMLMHAVPAAGRSRAPTANDKSV
jgi:hypothetical protein